MIFGITNTNTKQNPTDATRLANIKAKYKNRSVTKEKTTFNKIKNFFSAFVVKSKKLFNRTVTKIEDFFFDISLKLNKKAEELETYIKNIKTPFRKNYCGCNFAGVGVNVGRTKKLGDYLK